MSAPRSIAGALRRRAEGSALRGGRINPGGDQRARSHRSTDHAPRAGNLRRYRQFVSAPGSAERLEGCRSPGDFGCAHARRGPALWARDWRFVRAGGPVPDPGDRSTRTRFPRWDNRELRAVSRLHTTSCAGHRERAPRVQVRRAGQPRGQLPAAAAWSGDSRHRTKQRHPIIVPGLGARDRLSSCSPAARRPGPRSGWWCCRCPGGVPSPARRG